MNAETRRKLQEKARIIKDVEVKIMRLKAQKNFNNNPKKIFRIDESIRVHQIIKQGLMDSYWEIQ